MKHLDARTWLREFETAFNSRFKQLDKPTWGGEWSDFMCTVFHDVAKSFEAHCWCQFPAARGISKHHDFKEALEIDVTWYPRNGGKYDSVKLALEHEGSPRFNDAADDFWRVFHVAAPLRIFVGYAKDAEKRIDELLELRQPGGKDQFHSLRNGEDILLIGRPPMQSFADWYGRVWSGGRMHRLNKFLSE